MRKLLLAACLVSFSVPALASCDDVKSQIDAKLQAKGVKSYSLDIVPAAQAAPAAASGAAAAPAKATAGKVVGTCEGDTKQIIYKRN
jgi:Protein of unknown function (DUF1161)